MLPTSTLHGVTRLIRSFVATIVHLIWIALWRSAWCSLLCFKYTCCWLVVSPRCQDTPAIKIVPRNITACHTHALGACQPSTNATPPAQRTTSNSPAWKRHWEAENVKADGAKELVALDSPQRRRCSLPVLLALLSTIARAPAAARCLQHSCRRFRASWTRMSSLRHRR